MEPPQFSRDGQPYSLGSFDPPLDPTSAALAQESVVVRPRSVGSIDCRGKLIEHAVMSLR